MDSPSRMNPWDWIYATRPITDVGWYEPDPSTSIWLIKEAIARGGRSVIDIGGGGSWLVDNLLELGLERVAVLDIAEAGLAVARHRLGTRSDAVEWIVGDVTTVRALPTFDIWHDRAAFHFLLDPPARSRYVARLEQTIAPGGTAIIATFADDGPERCSGLPVVRWEPERLAGVCGPGFRLLGSRRHIHHTPAGVEQRFQYTVLQHLGSEGTDHASSGAI